MASSPLVFSCAVYAGRRRRCVRLNGWVPRDFWLEDWEKRKIIAFHLKNPLEGYRRLTFLMLDANIVAVSPAGVWRVLSGAGLLQKWNGPSKEGTGFDQPPTNRTESNLKLRGSAGGGHISGTASIRRGGLSFAVRGPAASGA
jgi:hypothetical protein